MAIAIGLDRKNSADFCLHSLLGLASVGIVSHEISLLLLLFKVCQKRKKTQRFLTGSGAQQNGELREIKFLTG
jgi:hypothetical protein